MTQARMSAAEFRAMQSTSAADKVARGRIKPDGMNKLETEYAAFLQGQMVAGRVQWFAFEGLKLRLADNTFYTPDFAVMLETGELEIHETKGYWEDDARVKIKVAAALFPMRFIAVKRVAKKDGGGWSTEVFE